MRPIYTTLVLVKNVYDSVPFFKEAMRIKERKTTRMVDNVANDIGIYITPIINISTKSGGTFSRKCSVDFLFCNPIKSKHPDAISQNLNGIRKYAADWLIG